MRASAQGVAGWRNCNLRTTFTKIVRRAGLVACPRLFHNLRSSRQTELAEHYPSHVVCDWLGNSEDIARKYYYQTTDEHFARAAEASSNAAKNPKQQSAEPVAANAEQVRETDRSKAKQNPKQLVAVLYRGESFAIRNSAQNDTPRHAAKGVADGEGFEPPVPLRIRQFSRLLP